jgi:hypothetical protein
VARRIANNGAPRVPMPAAGRLFHHLGRAGILARSLPQHAAWLRFESPGDEAAWDRLRASACRLFGLNQQGNICL